MLDNTLRAVVWSIQEVTAENEQRPRIAVCADEVRMQIRARISSADSAQIDDGEAKPVDLQRGVRQEDLKAAGQRAIRHSAKVQGITPLQEPVSFCLIWRAVFPVQQLGLGTDRKINPAGDLKHEAIGIRVGTDERRDWISMRRAGKAGHIA